MPAPGITLVGPTPAQPSDIAVKQLQEAQMQQLIMAMMEQGMQSGSPIVRTGSPSNPFSRDVMNLQPLGNIAEILAAKSHLGDVNAAQLDLARQMMERKAEDVGATMGALAPGVPTSIQDTMGEGSQLVPPGTPPIGTRPGDPYAALRAAAIANASSVPSVNALGNTILDAWIKGQQAQTPDAKDILGAARYLNPSDTANALTPGIFGPRVNPAGLVLKPQVVTQSPGQQTSTVMPQSGTSRIVVQPHQAIPDTYVAPGGQIPQPPGKPPVTNPNMNPMKVSSATGDISSLPGTATEAAMETTKDRQEQANMGQQSAQGFAMELPIDMQMVALAKSATTNGGNFGPGGEQINQVRKWAVQMGLSQDAANNITNYETFRKTAIPAITQHMREHLGARISNIEYVNQLEALGASGDTDPRSLLNITQQRVINGLNQINMHNKYTLPNLEQSNPGLSSQFQAPSIDVKNDVVAPLHSYGVDVDWSQDKQGFWHENNIPANTSQPGGTGLMTQFENSVTSLLKNFTGGGTPAPKIPDGYTITPVQ